MTALIRLAAPLFLALTALWLGASAWARNRRREALIRQWQEEGSEGEMELYLERGLQEYDEALGRKLKILTYILPVAIAAFVLYAVLYM